MSKELVVVRLSTNGPTLVAETEELADAEEAGFERVADRNNLLAKAPKTVEEALDTLVVPAAELFMDRLRRLAPQEVQFEFGLKLSGKAGLVFASAETEAHIQVTMKWTPEQT